ncbi:MAG: pyridoxal phosphate-dependent aminotransferase [Kiritimatiellae bacterium]|nr:pyridoxal phosphate-dependent aminotransferase [Kiritimatiellia bacterium]
MELNKNVLAIPDSPTLAISAKAKAYSAAGADVCNFGAGEPDFPTPAHIKTAAVNALQENQTRYGPAAGLANLRFAIAEKLKHENGLSYTQDQILVSNGAKHSLFNIMLVLCQPGDEILIPAPFWLSYPEMVHVAGGVPVYVPATESDGFKISPDALKAKITARSKALILNSPSNPTGAVYTGEELLALAELAVSLGLYIISDEIYEKIIYDGMRHVSVGSLSAAIFAKTITVNGFSKAYSMTGWRLGYFAAPKDIAKAASALQSHSTSGPNTFAQFGAVEALRASQDCVGEMVKAFAERRDYLYQRLAAIPGVTCVKPQGAFYMLPNIAASGLPSVEFAEKLLEAQKVAVVPGSAFGAEGTVRLSYATDMDTIRKGVDRLEIFLAAL